MKNNLFGKNKRIDPVKFTRFIRAQISREVSKELKRKAK